MGWETVANCVNGGCRVTPQACPGHSPTARRRLLVVVTNRQGCECVNGFTDYLFAADVPGFPYQWRNSSNGPRRLCDPGDITIVDTVLRCAGGSQGPASAIEYSYHAFEFGDEGEHDLRVTGDGRSAGYGIDGPAGICLFGSGPLDYDVYSLEGFTLIDEIGQPLFIQYRGVKVCGERPFLCGENGLVDITIIQDDP